MAVWAPSDDDPLFRVQGHPVRVTESLLFLYVAMWVALALCRSAHTEGWLVTYLPLSTPAVLGRGQVWQTLTYPFINPLSLGFAIEMLMLFWFGREVERAVGRRAFAFLYGGLVFFPALLLLGASLALRQPIYYAGSYNVHFALFISYALLFPNGPVFFGLAAKWVALITFSLIALIDVADHRWVDLAALSAGVGAAAFAIKVPFVSEILEWFRLRRDRRAFAAQQKQAEQKLLEDRRHQSIDPILEKISRHGIQSLTREERLVLERARLELIKRDAKR